MLHFDDIKSDTLNLRVSPSFKRALKFIGQRENRSMVNVLECLVISYFQKNDLTDADILNAAKGEKSEAAHARG